MEWFESFIVTNFVLLCIALVMLINSIQRYKQHPEISKYSIWIICCTIVLAISVTIEEYLKTVGNANLTLVFAIIGYTLRPVCIYLFILLSGQSTKNKWFFLTAIPLVVNFLIYCLGFIPGVREYIVFFRSNSDGTCTFDGGPLRFTSHIIAAGYLIWLIYLSFSMLKLKHLMRGLTNLGCALFVITAVVIETFFNGGDIHILNSTIAVSALVYYLYLYIEKTQIDTLTGAFNRETYYIDIRKMDKSITGVIQFDMNGLKYINDNFGHFEGDKALAKIADCIIKSATSKMYVYRLGGDEFLLLAVNSTKEEVSSTIVKFQKLISETEYHCSVGCYIRDNQEESAEEMMKKAEKEMYLDKERFYKTSKIERRKQ